MSRDFLTDCKLLRRPEVTDEHLQFSGPGVRAARTADAQLVLGASTATAP